MRKVYGLIRTLGATSKYKGYYFVAEAVKLSMGFAEKPVYVGRTTVKRYRKLQVTL